MVKHSEPCEVCPTPQSDQSSDGVPQVLLQDQDITFNSERALAVAEYSVLFAIAAFGNLTVFITLIRSRLNRSTHSRLNLFIMHLCIADLIVTFVMMPLEIVWHITVAWLAGDASCRLLMFWRAFGFYLSSFILVAISLDRYFAIARPLSLADARSRGRLMLILAWALSCVASIPQVRASLMYAWK